MLFFYVLGSLNGSWHSCFVVPVFLWQQRISEGGLFFICCRPVKKNSPNEAIIIPNYTSALKNIF